MKGRRFICKGVRQIEVEDFEIGKVPDNGILVRNEYTTVSRGTELWNWMHGSEPHREAKFPRPTGYCNAGTVLEVGKNVTDIKPGDCVAGQGNHASHAIMTNLITKVPENVSSKSAALLTMAAIAMHGVRVAKIELGEAVAVTGLGLVGQFALSLAKLSGALPVIAVDLDDKRLEKAKARGADVCINPGKVDDAAAAVRAVCVEDGANCVIEATGIPKVYPMAVKLACLCGRLIALGSPRGTVEFSFMEEVHLREVSILGAIHPRTPEQPHIYFWWTKQRERNLIFRLMSEGKLTAEDLITHVARPEDCLDIYNMLADNPADALGVVFDWTG
ncbi:MAG: zinc-binding alcohol dehydrogenase [Planctomycetota bacterium]